MSPPNMEERLQLHISDSNSASDEISKYNAYLLSLKPLNPLQFPFQPLPTPPSPLPTSSVCSISLLRTGTLTKFPNDCLLLGMKKGEFSSAPCHCFLIEKSVNNDIVRVLFELGVRRTEDHHSKALKRLSAFFATEVPSGAAKILSANNIPLSSISAVIIGHTHFDHIGDLSTFPSTTTLILGPSSHNERTIAEEMDVPLSCIRERRVKVLDRERDQWERVGALDGWDYFGDGSLWLLDTPGHKPGHLTALVRTSTHPSTYHLLGSDTAHEVSLLHSMSTSHPRAQVRAGLFPLQYWYPDADPRALTSLHGDLAEAYVSIAKVGRMDLEKNINVWLSHDPTMDRLFDPGELVRIDGGWEELGRLKGRERSWESSGECKR